MTYATTNLGHFLMQKAQRPTYVGHQFEPMDVCEAFGSTLERTPRPGDRWKSHSPLCGIFVGHETQICPIFFLSSFFRMLFLCIFLLMVLFTAGALSCLVLT